MNPDRLGLILISFAIGLLIGYIVGVYAYHDIQVGINIIHSGEVLLKEK